MNPRRVVVEDRVLALANELAAQGHPLLAAHLRDQVPESYGNCDSHVPAMLAGLLRVAHDVPSQRASAERVLDALQDLPGHIGRRGRVWMSHDRKSDLWGAYWEEDDWLEAGPDEVTQEEVMRWAHARSDEIHVAKH